MVEQNHLRASVLGYVLSPIPLIGIAHQHSPRLELPMGRDLDASWSKEMSAVTQT